MLIPAWLALKQASKQATKGNDDSLINPVNQCDNDPPRVYGVTVNGKDLK